MATTKEIQAALATHGYPLGKGGVDGIWGPVTRGAYAAFERDSKIVPADGVPDATSLKLLIGKASVSPILWMEVAAHLLGLREGQGAANNPVLLNWADDLDVHYPSDSIAWCGLFVAHCLREALPNEPLPSNILSSIAYRQFGRSCTPQPGAVLIFWRIAPTSGLGHVGFAIAESHDAYLVRGGNTHNSVADAWVSKARFLGARWPATSPILNRKLPAGTTGSLSLNEA